jgi:uncharacterized protein YhbP (UPF0306 family)
VRHKKRAANLMDVTHTQQVAAFLKSQSTLSLATTALNGTPHVTPLFYLADDDLSLYWLSSASSQHSRNLKRSPAAAVCVYSATEQWKEIRGVQMRGAVAIVTGRSTRREIVEAYCARFRLEPLFQAAIARSRLYCFQPEWVRYLDNSKRFGYKFELTIKENLV